MSRSKSTLALVLLAVAPEFVAAATSAARDILAEAKRINGARQHAEATERNSMRIVSAGGRERRREIRTFTWRSDDDDKKTIAFFLGPSEVKDVAFLQWSYPDRDADQWLYLPGLKRVRRLAQGLRDESFQGSDFTYGELDVIQNILDWDENKAAAALVRNEKLDGTTCAVIDLTPGEPEGGYTRFRLWLDTTRYVMRRLEFHGDDTGSPRKVLEFRDYREVDDVPVAHVLKMANIQSGSKTFVQVSDVRHDLELPRTFFTERTLKSGPEPLSTEGSKGEPHE